MAGTGLFNVNIEELKAAADEYSKAEKTYLAALENLKEHLSRVNHLWSDSSSSIWDEKIQKAKGEFSKLAERLNRNRRVLEQIATAAGETQTNVGTRITNL